MAVLVILHVLISFLNLLAIIICIWKFSVSALFTYHKFGGNRVAWVCVWVCVCVCVCTCVCMHMCVCMHVCVCVCMHVCSVVSDCECMDCSQQVSSVHGIFQARILEWVAISFSRGSFQPRDRTYISYISCVVGRFFTTGLPGGLGYTYSILIKIQTSKNWSLRFRSKLMGTSQKSD